MNNEFRITSRQAAFCRFKVMGLSDHQAALSAGFSERVASHPTQKLWARPGLRRYLEHLTRQIVPPAELVARVYAQLNSRNLRKKFYAFELLTFWGGYTNGYPADMLKKKDYWRGRAKR